MQSSYFLLLSLLTLSTGYIFDCLDSCECDTEDEVIHCHNGERTEVALPTKRLRGYPVLGFTFNKLVNLPEEDVLLKFFPDLQLVDVERNPFNCSSTKKYRTVKIISDCEKNITEIERIPPMIRPNRNCDTSCQLSRHASNLHEYVLKLWKIMKQKYDDFEYDKAYAQVSDFFIYVADKINNFRKEINERVKESQADSGEIEVPK